MPAPGRRTCQPASGHVTAQRQCPQVGGPGQAGDAEQLGRDALPQLAAQRREGAQPDLADAAGTRAAGAREPARGADPAGRGAHPEGHDDRRRDDRDGARARAPRRPAGRRTGPGEQQQPETGGGRGEDPRGQQLVGERGGDGEHREQQHTGRGGRPGADGDRVHGDRRHPEGDGDEQQHRRGRRHRRHLGADLGRGVRDECGQLAGGGRAGQDAQHARSGEQRRDEHRQGRELRPCRQHRRGRAGRSTSQAGGEQADGDDQRDGARRVPPPRRALHDRPHRRPREQERDARSTPAARPGPGRPAGVSARHTACGAGQDTSSSHTSSGRSPRAATVTAHPRRAARRPSPRPAPPHPPR